MMGKIDRIAPPLQFEQPFSEEEAARRLVMHVETLRKKRKAKQIRHIWRGRSALYTQAFLDEYNKRDEVAPCPKSDKATGSAKPADQPSGTSAGGMPTLDARGVKALAAQMKASLKSSSRSTS